MWRDFRLPIYATVTRKRFTSKYTAKIDFLVGFFYITIANADIGSLRPLYNYLISIFTTCWLHFTRIRWSELHIQNLKLFDKKKNGWTFLTKIFDAILEEVAESIVEC